MEEKTFKKELKRIRESKGLSITKLADESKVSRSYISMLENDAIKRDPQPETIKKLEDALGVEEGSLQVYAPSSSTEAIRTIYSKPENILKMNKLLKAIKKDSGVLDDVLKNIEE